MRSLIVPLADMIPAALARRPRHDAVELPAASAALKLLDDDTLNGEATAAADAAVTALASDDAFARVDFRRVRALVEREVQVSRGGPVHLTPLFVYLGAFSPRDVATRVVFAIGDALARLGMSVSLPAGPRQEDARRRRTTPAPMKRPAVGTRTTGLFAWA